MRCLSVLLGLGLTASVQAQVCVQVNILNEGPARGEVAHCPDGRIPAIVDGLGRFCPRDPCDTILFDAPGLLPVRMAWSTLAARGEVTLARAPRPLDAVEIVPWPGKKDRQALAALSRPDSLSRGPFNEASLENALSALPGVRMDQRGDGGSARLSIRGSILRSPYGTRGVKVYWGPFALTLADGSTQLELLDPLLAGSLDVVRSVGSPLYGSAPSGLLLADAPWHQGLGTTVEASAAVGSFGYYKAGVLLTARDSSGSAISIGAFRMDNDGYRRQEAAHRDQVFLSSQWRHGQGVTRAYLTLQSARWQLPGSVDSLTAQQDPQAPRAYSALIDAHISKGQVFAGVAHEQRLLGVLLLRTAVQVQAIEKENPYGTTPFASGYKDESIRGGGTRVSIGGVHGGPRLGFAWELGIEGLMERDDLFERDYAYAELGATRTDASTRVANLNGFLTTRTRLGRRTTVFADLGTERTGFAMDDALLGTTHTTSTTADLCPLVGMEEELSPGLTVHGRYACAASRPTIWEMLGTAGRFNTDLRSEEVRELEAGITLADADQHWSVEAVGYRRNTDRLLLQRALDSGGTVFQNAGDAHQDGVELTASLRQSLPRAHGLVLRASGSWQQHELELPERNGVIPVPGVPRWTASGALGWRTPWGLSVQVEGRTVADVPAGVTTSVLVPGYTLWSARADLAWARPWGAVTFFLRGENLLDARYTAFVQLDDPGGRYYNPGPARGLSAGLALRFSAGRAKGG